MFSHTFFDLHTDTTDIHAKSADVITEPRTHIFIHKLTSEYKSPHSSVFIRNQTTTQPSCWRSEKFQQPSQVVLQNRHPDLSIYASLSSSTTFSIALPLPKLSPRKQKKAPSLALLQLRCLLSTKSSSLPLSVCLPQLAIAFPSSQLLS
jgi:hypothetical protein